LALDRYRLLPALHVTLYWNDRGRNRFGSAILQYCSKKRASSSGTTPEESSLFPQMTYAQRTHTAGRRNLWHANISETCKSHDRSPEPSSTGLWSASANSRFGDT
jgi:hypothetical protein